MSMQFAGRRPIGPLAETEKNSIAQVTGAKKSALLTSHRDISLKKHTVCSSEGMYFAVELAGDRANQMARQLEAEFQSQGQANVYVHASDPIGN